MTLARAQRIARYGGRAPRYTSYPTANHFQPLDPNTVDWPRASSPASLYVHVPYCTKLCWYCGCNTTIRRDRSISADFVDVLLTELELRVARTGTFEIGHLALGGGTPNFLPIDQLQRLMDGIESLLTPNEAIVRSTELDPRTVEDDQLSMLTKRGFTHFSLGVQSLDLAVQQAVNRPLDPMRLGQIVQSLRRDGAQSINLDLMVGLPRQTTVTLDGTLDTVLAIRPDRLAVFQYAHMPSLRPAQKLLAKHGLPDVPSRDLMFQHITRRLVEAGYERVGFDHFALPEDPLARANRAGTLKRNFQGFTSDPHGDLVGLGPSAIGRTGPWFSQNHRGVTEWTKAVLGGELPIARGLHCTPEDLLTSSIIEDLMCGRGADLARLGGQREGVEARLAPMLEDGLISMEAHTVTVTPHGFDFVRSIAAAFDHHLDRSAHASVS